MKKKDVELHAIYACKVSGRIVPVKIISLDPLQGINQNTGRIINFRSARRLRHKYQGETP